VEIPNKNRGLPLVYYAFEKAITLDPTFAEAYAALAITCATDFSGRGSNWVKSPPLARSLAMTYAAKASSLKPDLAGPEIALALLSHADRQYEIAVEHARIAVTREPSPRLPYPNLRWGCTHV
jgi:hypothetical protein